jgi:hypothetical protein
VSSILPKHFHIVVDEMSKLVVKIAKEGRRLPAHLPYRKALSSLSGSELG